MKAGTIPRLDATAHLSQDEGHFKKFLNSLSSYWFVDMEI